MSRQRQERAPRGLCRVKCGPRVEGAGDGVRGGCDVPKEKPETVDTPEGSTEYYFFISVV